MKFKLIGENDLEVFGVEDKKIKSHSGEIYNGIMLAYNKITKKVRLAGEKDLANIRPLKPNDNDIENKRGGKNG